MRLQPHSPLRPERPFPSTPRFWKSGVGGNGVPGEGAVANNSSGSVHPIPGRFSRGSFQRATRSHLRAHPPRQPSAAGPELCAQVRDQTEPNRLFQVVPCLEPGRDLIARKTYPPATRHRRRKVSPARNTASRTAGTPGAQGGGAARQAARAQAVRPGRSEGGDRRRSSRRGRPGAGRPGRERREERPIPSKLPGSPNPLPRARRAVSGARPRGAEI